MARKSNFPKKYKKLKPSAKLVLYSKIQNLMATASGTFVNDSAVYSYILGLALINKIPPALAAAVLGFKGTALALATTVKNAEAFIGFWADIANNVANGDVSIMAAAGFDPTDSSS